MALVMDLNFLTVLLNNRVDELTMTSFMNNTSAVMRRYKDVQTLIKACGHDTRALDQAIIEAREALLRLDQVQEQARCKFKADGICFVVDESKRKEAELERLT